MFTRFVFILASLLFLSGIAMAQDDTPAALPNEGRISRPMLVIDPVTLKAEGVEIKIWGIKAVQSSETPLSIQAMTMLDGLVSGQVVNCKIEGGAIPNLSGRCIVGGTNDLALALLNNGFAVRDRRATYNTPYATAYGEAEEFARLNRKGVWSYLSKGAEEEGALSKHIWTMGVILGLVMLGGFALVGFILWASIQKMAQSQKQEREAARRSEAVLETRERNVLLTTIEGELQENKNKIEAFLVIYGDMLRSLKDPAETPKYQQVGDIVQKRPGFSKTVFEANAGKMSILGIKLAGRISKLYAALPKEQEYINLEPTVPIDTAVALVEKILAETQELVPAIDSVMAELRTAAQQE